ncbi:unnamed protein product [Ixodes persulcatus]
MAPVPSRPLIGPPIFKGSPDESVTEWLTCYEHVASLNAWDSETKVKCLYLALDGDARKWYTTQILTKHQHLGKSGRRFCGSLSGAGTQLRWRTFGCTVADSCPSSPRNNIIMTFCNCVQGWTPQ